MKVLILGGTGVMGAALVQILIKGNNDIYVTSRKEYSDSDNVHYLLGNAQNIEFLEYVLNITYWDAIVDFMSYTTISFKNRVDKLLGATKQYFYLSSGRVYADSYLHLTEDSPRLLDTCKDCDYLATDEYALAKAMQEDVLKSTKKNNWTIIRPYITYSKIRLQLGFYEKEMWLRRVLQGKSIVWSEEIGDKITTLSNGNDVAYMISCLIGNKKALGETFNVLQSDFFTWNEILEIYKDVLYKETQNKIKIVKIESLLKVAATSGRKYQYLYDRQFNRVFDNSKIKNFISLQNDFITVSDGLAQCVKAFLGEDNNFKVQDINWKYEGYVDRLTGDRTPIRTIPGIKNKIRYLVCKYTSYIDIKY